jgi:hypothetical protein
LPSKLIFAILLCYHNHIAAKQQPKTLTILMCSQLGCGDRNTNPIFFMRLLHYTALFYLPSIMKDGLLPCGELPLLTLDCPKAINLTTNASIDDQKRIWTRGSVLDKTKIRIVLDLEPNVLTSFNHLREQYRKAPPMPGIAKSKSLKNFAPIEERKHWFYYFDTIPPEQFVAVERLIDSQYIPLQHADLAELVATIQAEIDRAFLPPRIIASPGLLKGTTRRDFKPGIFSSWLLDNDQ